MSPLAFYSCLSRVFKIRSVCERIDDFFLIQQKPIECRATVICVSEYGYFVLVSWSGCVQIRTHACRAPTHSINYLFPTSFHFIPLPSTYVLLDNTGPGPIICPIIDFYEVVFFIFKFDISPRRTSSDFVFAQHSLNGIFIRVIHESHLVEFGGSPRHSFFSNFSGVCRFVSNVY